MPSSYCIHVATFQILFVTTDGSCCNVDENVCPYNYVIDQQNFDELQPTMSKVDQWMLLLCQLIIGGGTGNTYQGSKLNNSNL